MELQLEFGDYYLVDENGCVILTIKSDDEERVS
jgi:hypothetical protein